MRVIIIICCLVFTFNAIGQKRLTPPKSKTNISSVDQFVEAAFTIYNTTFEFHYGPESLTEEAEQEAVGENQEYEDEELEDLDAVETSETDGDTKDEFQVMEESIQQLLQSVPDILEEIDSHSVSRQVKATLNVNKAIKALKQSGKMVKATFTGQ